MTGRTPTHAIEPIFLNRWSPRAYDGHAMPTTDLLAIIEAARWAPSAYNIQPWRFVYSQRDDAAWPRHLDLLDPFNAGWAQHAAALVFIASDTLMPGNGGRPDTPSRTHSFDAGAAWAQLALQATALGYQAHAMAGVDFDKAHDRLAIPPRFRVEVAVALGNRADPSVLPEDLRERETPSQRLPLGAIAFPGSFPAHSAERAA